MQNNKKNKCLNRTVLGIGITSFFSDLGHETATAILPMFLASIGAAPFALGIIEGIADAVSSFTKLGSGWYSDRVQSRKPIAVTGYFLTAVSKTLFAFATSWIHVLAGRTLGWLGRGIRGPVRDAIMSQTITPETRGRAFGFERALDTLGAILGPVAALWLIGFTSYRNIFLLAIIPGMFAVISFSFLVKENSERTITPRSFLLSLKVLPNDFKKYLIAVGIFGMGDFAHTLLILRATQILSNNNFVNASQLAISLYVVHNIVYAVMSYPVGALGDRFGKKTVLAIGYAISGIMCFGFLFPINGYFPLMLLFVAGGLYIAIEDSLERALAADMLPGDLRGTGFGVLATVNGIGDFVSSIIVGFLWSAVSVGAGFAYAGILSFLGAFFVIKFIRNT